jgi:hypothetical protein
MRILEGVVVGPAFHLVPVIVQLTTGSQAWGGVGGSLDPRDGEPASLIGVSADFLMVKTAHYKMKTT